MATETTVRVYLLDNPALHCGDRQISCETNRARKVWGLLAYLFCHRKTLVPAEELLRELWSEEDGTNPASAMKTTMFWLRAMLDELRQGLGHSLILYKNGGYYINPEVPLYTDIDDFENLIQKGQSQGEPKDPKPFMQALVLYRKDFFAIQSTESWVIPIAMYYHDLYIQALIACVKILEQQGRYEMGVEVCRRGIQVDPYCESFYQSLMRCLLALKQRQEVVTLYEDMSRLLMNAFGVVPDDESRALYRQALDSIDKRTITPDMLEERLVEPGPVSGALLCDFEFFKNVYQANARALDRSGDAIHIVLLSVKGKDGTSLSKRSLDTVMENLESHICKTLRRGDVVTKCSVSQFIIMLPQAGYESSILVCDRIIKQFYRLHNRAPAAIEYHIQPMRAPAK